MSQEVCERLAAAAGRLRPRVADVVAAGAAVVVLAVIATLT